MSNETKPLGDISYWENKDGSLTIWINRSGDPSFGRLAGTSMCAGVISRHGYLDIRDAKRIIDSLAPTPTPTETI